MFGLFLKGGPVMWPLLLLSIVTLAVVFERIIFLVKQKFSQREADVKRILELSVSDDLETAMRAAPLSPDPVVRIIGEGLKHADDCFQEAISCASEAELDSFDRGTSLLDTAVTLAPLMGLLGTVTGMIRSFGILGSTELDAPLAITGGVAEALIATAFGLTVAIVALVPLNMIRSAREKFVRRVEDNASRIEILLKSGSTKRQKQSRAA